MSDKKLYADRECDELEPFYTDHICAMTGEQLHAKADIAAELAYRDKENQALRAQVALLKDFSVMQDHLRDYSILDMKPDQCLAEIEAAAVERAVDDLQYEPLPFEDSPDEDYCLSSELKEWAASRREEAQE